jgi:hypothetical protein
VRAKHAVSDKLLRALHIQQALAVWQHLAHFQPMCSRVRRVEITIAYRRSVRRKKAQLPRKKKDKVESSRGQTTGIEPGSQYKRHLIA